MRHLELNFVCKLSGMYMQMKICYHYNGHMTKMAAMLKYIENPFKIFFSGTGDPISTKLGMKHWRLLPFIFCTNNDCGWTLTYFMAKSKFVT